MRVTREKAAENRARIVETASRLFRERGFDGVGLDAIMKDVGLTHGGFYGHFTSKEDLAAEAVAHALEQGAELQRDIRISPILFLVICPKAISQIARMAVRWPRWPARWRAEAKESAPVLHPMCALRWGSSRAFLGAPPPPGVGALSPPSPELSAH